MGLLDRIMGRTEPPKPDLDQLFAIPSAAITLETAAGLRPTGLGSVCFRAVEGGDFTRVQAEIQALLDVDEGPKVEVSNDSYGYTWLLVRHDPSEVAELVTDLHAINSTLEDNGYGPTLLCSLVSFVETGGAGRRVALVYLYKRGTFYPFVPLPGERRDNALEIQVRGVVANDLRIEAELGRWFPVWGAPGL
jgi:hypothetical protein